MRLFGRAKRSEAPIKVSSVSVAPERAREMIDDGAVILDVREHHEWNAGHAPGARHLPLGQVRNSLEHIPCDCTVIVVCRSGHRSAEGVRALREAGIDAVNLHGGMHAWSSLGLPIETPDGRKGKIA